MGASPDAPRRRLSVALALAVGVQGPLVAHGEVRRLTRHRLSDTAPGSIFQSVGRSGQFVPLKTFAYQAGPLPTNAWWENFATAENPESEQGNVFQMPYVIMTCAQAVHVIQPVMSENQDMDFQRSAGVSLGIIEGETADGPYAADWDDLSMTMGWRGGEKGWKMQVPLVRGSPYVTAEFNGVVPRVSSLQQLRMHNGQHWISVDGTHHPCDGRTPLQGRVFAVDVLEHDKTWLILAPTHNGEGSRLEWVCQGQPFSLTATSKHTGAVRVALANDCTTGAHPVHCQGAPHGKDASQYAQLLVTHGGTYPTSGKIDFSVDGDRGTMTWAWDVRTMRGFQPTDIVQLAWPVHKPLLSSGTDPEREVHESTPFKDVRGPTVAVVGSVWDLHFDLMPEGAGFGAFHKLDDRVRQEIIETLAGPRSGMWNNGAPDKDFDLPENFKQGLGDTYFSGKLFGRLAQLVAIADQVGQTNEPWFRDMVDRLAMRMETWLSRDSPTPFLYDVSWGGLISCGCEVEDCNGGCQPRCKKGHDNSDLQSCPALMDEFSNFGNSVYNDHHFHYGYWVYAASVLAKFKPEWEQQYREQILALVRDYANPSEADPSFPVVRHKDWFLTFSWAGGISAADERGRNQESTSEAVNAYYAIYTYGKEMEGKVPWARDLKDLGRIWMAMEAHGAETYWQIRSESEVYNAADFPDHVIGILWSNSATHKTWFSKHDYAVSGIQLLPFTPASESYLKADWVTQHIDEFRRDCDMDRECAKGWSWTVCMEQAIIDKDGALSCIHSMPENYFAARDKGSGGNSLSNSLYWIGTRDQYSHSRIKTTLMPRASALPALSMPANEQDYASGQGRGGLNAGIAQGLATHGMINRFFSGSIAVGQGSAAGAAAALGALGGLAALGALLGGVAWRALLVKASGRSGPGPYVSMSTTCVADAESARMLSRMVAGTEEDVTVE